MKDNPFPKIEIKEGQSKSDTEITIDGKKINGVSKYVIVHEAGKHLYFSWNFQHQI